MNLYERLEVDPFPEYSNLLRAHGLDFHPFTTTHKVNPFPAALFTEPEQLETEIQSLLLAGKYVACLAFIKQNQLGDLLDSPVLLVYRALAMSFCCYARKEIEELLTLAEAVDTDQRHSGAIAAVRAQLKINLRDPYQAIEEFLQALEQLTEDDTIFRQHIVRNLGFAWMIKGELFQAARWYEDLLLSSYRLQDHHGILTAYHYLTNIRKIQGRLNEANIIYQKALAFIEDNGLEKRPHSIKILAGYGHLWIQWHALDQAKYHLQKAIQHAKSTDILLAQKAYQDLSEIFIREHDFRSALTIIQECRQHLQSRNSDYYFLINQELLAIEARIHLAMGRMDQANAWLKASGFEDLAPQAFYTKLGTKSGYFLPVVVSIYLKTGQYHRALDLIKTTLPKFLQTGANSYLIRGLNLLAITYQRLNQPPKAIKALLKAVDLAKPENNLGDFVFIGQDLLPLLYELIESGIETEFCGKLVNLASGLSAAESAETRYLNEVDPLSSREMDVLHLIASGMTNREIAGSLFLSANTIKSHSIKIYRKLNVNNRTQAVSKARLLGILPAKHPGSVNAST